MRETESIPPVARYEEWSSFWKRHSKLKKVLAVAIPVLIVVVVVIGILSQEEKEEEKGIVLKGCSDMDGFNDAAGGYLIMNASEKGAWTVIFEYGKSYPWPDGSYKTPAEIDKIVNSHDYIEIRAEYYTSGSYGGYVTNTYKAIKVVSFEDRSP